MSPWRHWPAHLPSTLLWSLHFWRQPLLPQWSANRLPGWLCGEERYLQPVSWSHRQIQSLWHLRVAHCMSAQTCKHFIPHAFSSNVYFCHVTGFFTPLGCKATNYCIARLCNNTQCCPQILPAFLESNTPAAYIEKDRAAEYGLEV